MSKESETLDKINKLVLNGLAPVAFYNSYVKEFNNEANKELNDLKKLNKKYKQIELPRGACDLTISKVYELS